MKVRWMLVTSVIASLTLLFVMGNAEAKKTKEKDKTATTEVSTCTQTVGAFPVDDSEESGKSNPLGLKGEKPSKGQKDKDEYCSLGALPKSKDG